MGTNGKKANEIMCDVLVKEAKKNKNIVVLTSDSRGSGSLTPFAEELPEQIVEVGIAEQNLVGIAAGLAHDGKRSFAVSPACFLTMRSIEQIKVDVAYSNTNVKLIGISGGASYGNLGSTHHSLQDLAITRAIPNLEVFMPCDKFETNALFEYLVHSDKPAYVRIGKKILEDCYDSYKMEFKPGKANVLKNGKDIAIAATGETVSIALKASDNLIKKGISCSVVDFHTIKPFDKDMAKNLADKIGKIISIEEHSIYGGLGSSLAEALSEVPGCTLKILGFPDEPSIAGTQSEIFRHYGIEADNISKVAESMINL